MKVVITKEFEDQYNDLFAEMETLLGNDGVSEPNVDSLPTYFSALDHFRKKVAETGNKNRIPKKFYRLPLEEPAFIVNLDSRMIDVPVVFKNNGLGTKGDTNAEIIFFKVPRWYDTMDLYPSPENQTAWIVQWVNSSNHNVKSGNSPVVLADALENEVIFGWLITHDMTEQSGNLEFALRFYKLNGDVLEYSLATQKASCAIKPTLDLDIINTEIDTDLDELIYTRPIYSGIINSMNGAAPTITEDLLTYLGDKVVNGEAELSINDPVYDEEDPQYNSKYEEIAPDGVLRLKVAATSPDGGTIIYRWYNGRQQLTDINGNLDTDAEYIATTAGTYFAQIGNNNTNTGTRWVSSDTIVVPKATELSYGDITKFPAKAYSTGNEDSAMVFDVTGFNKETDVKYTWTITDREGHSNNITQGVNGNTYIPPVNTEGIVSCTAINHRNNTESAPLVVKQACELRAEPDTPSQVQVQWDSSEGKVYATVTFEEGSPSANWENEWVTTWTRETNVNGNQSSVTLNEKGLFFNPSLTPPTQAGQVNTYVYSCNVAHTVFAGTAMAKTSSAQYSNKLILEVAYDKTVTARVQ